MSPAREQIRPAFLASRISRLVRDGLALRRLPVVTIELSGGEGCRSLFRDFTRRHPRWRVIQSHAWGVALLRVPDSYESFLRGPERAHFRREVNRAYRFGFTVSPINGVERLDEIMAINRSAEVRQGQPMLPGYLDEAAMRRYFSRSPDVFGVADAEGVLQGYLSLHTCGEIASVELLLGHADALPRGVMWPLFATVVEEVIRRRAGDGSPTWLMYDMISGASVGLRQFKRWVGFEAYRVRWRWRGP
jgi:hypothetical protein